MNPGDKFCFKCGSKVPETSHSSVRISTPEDERALSSSSTKSLSQYLASKVEERRGFNKPNKAGFKRKVNNPGSSSKRVMDNRVVINVGLITENKEGNLAIIRGSKVALKVGKDFGAVEVCQAAVKKRTAHYQFFCGDEDYILLYPDQKPVHKVPGSDKDFSLAKYKQELAKPYSKVDLYICKETEFEKDRETDDMADRRAEKKPCKDNLIDIPSDDHWMFDHPVFESPAEPVIDDYQIPPAASCGVSVRQHGQAISTSPHQVNLAARDGIKTECPTCHGHFLADEIAVHADLCAENAHRFSFLGLMETPPPDDIPDEFVASLAETCTNTASNVLPLSDLLSPLVDKLESQLRINVRRGQLFLDYVEARKRCQWIKPENRLKVVFVGEPAEDSGGPRREFFAGQFFHSFHNLNSKLIYINIKCSLKHKKSAIDLNHGSI